MAWCITHGEEYGGPGQVHRRLVEQQPIAPAGGQGRDQREVVFTVWEGNGKEIICFFGVGRKWEGKK